MHADRLPVARRRAPLFGAAAVALGAYAFVVSRSKPFTAAADLLTAVAFAVLGAVLVRTIARRRRRGRPPTRAGRPAYGLWAVAVAAFGCFELFTYFAGFSGRHAYPTLSSLADTAFHWQAAKGAVFALWIGLGWGLVRR